MRKIIFLLLVLSGLALSHASTDGIQSVTIAGQQAYELEAGHFSNENSALQLKFKLSATLKQPITIERSKDKQDFVVKIGPINDYQLAQNIQASLNHTSIGANDTVISQPANQTITTNQEAPPIQDNLPPQTPDKKLWNLANADIRAVIAEVSRVTGKNFIIDPRVQGKISIVSSTPMSDKELYQVFLSMLQVSGYAAIPTGNVVKIIPNLEAKTVSSDLLNQMRNPPRGDDMLVEVVPVRYVPAEQLVPVLRPLMPQWSNVSAYAPSNMLILSGRANNIKSLSNIIKQVDSSSANGIDIIRLKHTLAMDMVNTLKDLVKTQPGMSGGHAQTTLAADDHSNAILLSGNRTERIRLRLLISSLDRANQNGTNSNTQVVYLHYLRAEDLVPILAGIAQANFSGNVGTTIGTVTRPELDSTNPASNIADNNSSTPTALNPQTYIKPNSASTTANNTTGATTQNEGTTKPTVQIIAEPNTNSIILNAPATLIRTLKNVISQLDIRPAQLLIEALVAEVDENDANNLGIEWGYRERLGRRGFGEEAGREFRPGFAIINSRTRVDNFQAQIYALARQRKANILSTPSVVVLDNRQAKILVGKQVSVSTTSYPNNANGTTAASPFTTFNRVNVALHLYVRPQITNGQGIQLQIDQGNDTLEPGTEITNNANPTFKISSIVTSVHVESGDIVVLGGLTQDGLSNDDNKLPILGSIPGVGRLFQHNIRAREKRVLMVFIRTIILKNENEALQVSNGKYRNVRDTQLDILRSQETFVQSDDQTLLPPPKKPILPRPFSNHLVQTK